MSKYEAEGLIIEKVEWKAPAPHYPAAAVSVHIAIPAEKFTGIDITRPITITQDDE